LAAGLRFALGSHLSEKDMTRLLDAIKNL